MSALTTIEKNGMVQPLQTDSFSRPEALLLDSLSVRPGPIRACHCMMP